MDVPHFCWSIRQPMNIWVVSRFWLLWIMFLWTLMYKFLLKYLFSSFWGIYPGVELLDYYEPFFIPDRVPKQSLSPSTERVTDECWRAQWTWIHTVMDDHKWWKAAADQHAKAQETQAEKGTRKTMLQHNWCPKAEDIWDLFWIKQTSISK